MVYVIIIQITKFETLASVLFLCSELLSFTNYYFKKPYYQHSRKIENTNELGKTTFNLYVRLAENEQVLKFSFTNRCVIYNQLYINNCT